MSKNKNVPQSGDAVIVKWTDAAALDGEGYWNATGKAKTHKPVKVKSVGFLVKASKRRVTIMQAVHEHGECGGIFTIPTDWIVSMKKLS